MLDVELGVWSLKSESASEGSQRTKFRISTVQAIFLPLDFSYLETNRSTEKFSENWEDGIGDSGLGT